MRYGGTDCRYSEGTRSAAAAAVVVVAVAVAAADIAGTADHMNLSSSAAGAFVGRPMGSWVAARGCSGIALVAEYIAAVRAPLEIPASSESFAQVVAEAAPEGGMDSSCRWEAQRWLIAVAQLLEAKEPWPISVVAADPVPPIRRTPPCSLAVVSFPP